jgi:beta-galactosidase/beta-glucuronidase
MCRSTRNAKVRGLLSTIRFDVHHNGELIASKTVKGTEAVIPIPNPKLWDEFSPNLYTLDAHMSHSYHTTHFAMRDLRVQNKRLVLNGSRIFLRGTLECCIFPKTGYPPTDLDSWLRIFKIAKSYGLNHMRFHSWCPPEAAFEAADRMGFLLHVELPQWVGDVGKDKPRDDFIIEEMLRILDTYGNHPSFGMLCMGNELRGDESFLQNLVLLGQKYDPRHLYTPSTAWSHGEHDDYDVGGGRGLHGPTTDADFTTTDAEFKVPVITHEVGHAQVHRRPPPTQLRADPRHAQGARYTGSGC